MERKQKPLDQKKKILKFIKKHQGQLCLDYYDVVRLIGFHEDEDDYYYDVQKVGAEPNGRYHTSCVGLMTPLKGKIPARDYKIIDTVFTANWNMHHDFVTYEKQEAASKVVKPRTKM